MTTTLEEFIKLVEEMRELQKLYFKNRSLSILNNAKVMERQVDKEIKRLKDEFKRDATQLDFNFD